MRTETINIYQFSELSDEAKEKAIQEYNDINVDDNWWIGTYDDAKTVGIKITGFEVDHYCHGELETSATDTATKIIDNHGETCETYKTATQLLADWKALVSKFSDGTNTDEVSEDNEYEFDQEADELEEEFKKSILEDYRIILRKEFEYLQSEEAIRETIEANEYEFHEDGTKY